METNIDNVREGSVGYGISGGLHHPPWIGGPNGGPNDSGSVKYGKTGSINGGYVASDNEMVYGYPQQSSIRSNSRGRGNRGRPPSSLRLDVGL